MDATITPRRTVPTLLGAIGALALASVFAVRPDASACAIVSPAASAARIAGEEVVIAWDEVHHREHFIRAISFRDATSDFGFLVPTPGRPEIAEANPLVFNALYDIYHRHEQPLGDDEPRRRGHAALGAGPSVSIIQHTQVAGLDATTLSANDAGALTQWLQSHHYPTTPALQHYLEPYVARHWFITAFQYAPGAGRHDFGARAVRLSFDTDRAFFPYAEPDDAPVIADRVFRLSIIARERMVGRVGTHEWRARLRYAGARRVGSLTSFFPDHALDGLTWITTYQERGATRGRDDLYFSRDRTQTARPSDINTRVE